MILGSSKLIGLTEVVASSILPEISSKPSQIMINSLISIIKLWMRQTSLLEASHRSLQLYQCDIISTKATIHSSPSVTLGMSDDPLDVAGLVVAVGVEQVDVCCSNPHLALEANGDDFKMVLEISSGIFEPDEPALELEVVVRVSVGSLAGCGSHTCFVLTLHIYSIPSLQQLITELQGV